MPQIKWPIPWNEEIHMHFSGFVNSFIKKNFRPRWEHVLLTKPDKAKNELHRFEHHNDSRKCTLLDNTSLLSFLDIKISLNRGLFFDGYGLPEFQTGKEIANRFWGFTEDSIFSIEAGKKVIVISHDGYGWLCVK